MTSDKRSRPARQLRSVPTPPADPLPVEDLRARAVLARTAGISRELAAAIGALAYGSPETWRAAR